MIARGVSGRAELRSSSTIAVVGAILRSMRRVLTGDLLTLVFNVHPRARGILGFSLRSRLANLSAMASYRLDQAVLVYFVTPVSSGNMRSPSRSLSHPVSVAIRSLPLRGSLWRLVVRARLRPPAMRFHAQSPKSSLVTTRPPGTR
jgi:hypothetical protein